LSSWLVQGPFLHPSTSSCRPQQPSGPSIALPPSSDGRPL
jgi:hypothetical protein